MKTENLERAKELFEKEPGVNTVYFTKDGNMFRALHYAEGWDKDGIETISRSLLSLKEKFDALKGVNTEVKTEVETENEVKAEDEVKTEVETENEVKAEDEVKTEVEAEKEVEAETKTDLTPEEEKANLVKQYIELFDGKPNHMLGIAKLKERIAEKLAEVKTAE